MADTRSERENRHDLLEAVSVDSDAKEILAPLVEEKPGLDVLWEQRDKLTELNDQTLNALFHKLKDFEKTLVVEVAKSFRVRCYLCHILSERNKKGGPGLRKAAAILGCSYSQASTLSGVYKSIFARTDKVFALGKSLYQRAYEICPSRGVDPLDALAWAEERYRATEGMKRNEKFTVRKFDAGVKSGQIPGHEVPALRSAAPDIAGDVLGFRGMAYCPRNEAGVILLFARMMDDLGITYESSPLIFPDMIGRRRDRRGNVRVGVEFEYRSINYKNHKHHIKHPDECDIIICWEHDWPDCPDNLEVIELKSEVEKLKAQGD